MRRRLLPACLAPAALALLAAFSCEGRLRPEPDWTAARLAEEFCRRDPSWEWQAHSPESAVLRRKGGPAWEECHALADEPTLLTRRRGVLYVGRSFRRLGNAAPSSTLPVLHLFLRGHPEELAAVAELVGP